MTADELRQAEVRHQRALQRARETLERRDMMIRTAIDEGWTHARISKATGLTRGRIGQIAMTRP